MIIDQLKKEINIRLTAYQSQYSSVEKIPPQRQKNISIIKNILKIPEPMILCRELNNYLDEISVPFFSWLTFIDVNAFVRSLKEVLGQSKYQTINLLITLLKEKDEIIAKQTFNACQKMNGNLVENKIDYILSEIKLLRSENSFLYATLDQLDKKIKAIEVENKNNLIRAQRAEAELATLKNSLVSGNLDLSETTSNPSKDFPEMLMVH